MKQKPKNLVALFVICLILIPSLIYGGTATVGKEQTTTNNAILKKIVVSPKAVQVPTGANEKEFRDMIEVKAYYKDVAEPKVVKDYTTDYDAIKPQKGSKTVVVSYTDNGCTKKAKVCVTFCKTAIDESSKNEINFPYISGYPDGTFRPNQAVTRAEFAAMIARLLTKNNIPTEQNQFKDVPNYNFSTNAINYVSKLGLMKPFEDGTFRPESPVTLAEAREVIPHLATYLKTAPVEVPAGEGDLSRTQAVVILNKLFDIDCNNKEKTSNFSDVTPSTPYYKDIICATRAKVTPR